MESPIMIQPASNKHGWTPVVSRRIKKTPPPPPPPPPRLLPHLRAVQRVSPDSESSGPDEPLQIAT